MMLPFKVSEDLALIQTLDPCSRWQMILMIRADRGSKCIEVMYMPWVELRRQTLNIVAFPKDMDGDPREILRGRCR